MQLAAVIPLLMVNDFECGPRLATAEIRRRQLALSLKRMTLIGKDDPKVASLLKSVFALPNDLDQNFLKRTGQPSNRMYKHPELDSASTSQMNASNALAGLDPISDTDLNTLSISVRGSSPTPPVQSIYSLPTFTSTAPSIPVSGVRMEGSVAVCTGRRSWSEEWAVLTAQNFTITSALTSKHHR